MAVTGLIMIAFLLMHMYGNLKAFMGAEAFDPYAHWLKSDILYPILPKGGFIWVFRFGLVAAVVLHIWSAASLSVKTLADRGPKYVNYKRQAQTYSARTMRWGGVIVLAFLIFHLIQFTIVPGSFGGDAASPYTMLIASFTQVWMVALYAVCMVLVCMHVRHGFWSAFTTLGANTSANARKWLNILAIIVAVALFVGFMSMPVAVLFGAIS